MHKGGYLCTAVKITPQNEPTTALKRLLKKPKINGMEQLYEN